MITDARDGWDKSFADTLAQKMAEKIAELFDCDLGSGVYGMFH